MKCMLSPCLTGIFSLILALIPGVGQRRQNQQAASTNSFKEYNASIKNTTSPQGHPKSSFSCKVLEFCPQLVFLLVFFSDPSIFPQLVCGRVHFDKDDQLCTIKGVDMNLNMHFGTSSALLLVMSWTATVFEASFRQIWAQGFFAVKYACQTEWLDSTNKTYVNTAVASSEM